MMTPAAFVFPGTTGAYVKVFIKIILEFPAFLSHPFIVTITSRLLPLLIPRRMAESSVNTSSLPPASEIPSRFIESAKQWWASGEKASAISEERLLR